MSSGEAELRSWYYQMTLSPASNEFCGVQFLCRYSDTEFVVVLTQTDSIAAAAVASRIAEIIVEARPSLMETARLTLGVASAPNDGRTLQN